MNEPTGADVLIYVAPSPFRRLIGVGCMVVLGGLLISLALTEISGVMRFLFLILGMASIWGGDMLRRATTDIIELTRTELRTGKGLILARVDNIRAVERSPFAFKPSNGFLVRLIEPQGRGWAPGLWWQRGRILGVGGVVPGGQARAMADLLSALIKGQLPE